jgi:hypothetical protein
LNSLQYSHPFLLAWLEEAFWITILAVEMFAALRRRRPRFAGMAENI